MKRIVGSPYTAAVLLLSMATIASLTLGGYSYRLLERGRLDAVQQQRARDDAQARYQRSGDERDMLTRYAPEYRALEQHGFIGAEQRVNWIDSLRVANAATRLFGVQYQISAQTQYAAPELAQAGLMQSPMKIDLQLMHEGDLMRFLRALANQRAGVFVINECALERIVVAEPAAKAQPNLRADCDLAWITAPRQQTGDRQ